MTQEDTPTPDPKIDSVTKVYHELPLTLEGILSGVRKSISFKLDTGIVEEVKPILKRKYGSYCCAIESWFTAEIVADRALGVAEITGRVHPSNTVKIQDFHIHRNLRARRRLDPDSPLLEDTPEEVAVRVEEEERRNQEMRELENKVIDSLTPWNGRSIDIYEKLYAFGIKEGEAYELHKNILKRLQDRLHSGVSA